MAGWAGIILLVGIGVLVVLPSNGHASVPSGSAASRAGFAGFYIPGSVHSIEASFNVPVILGNSAPGQGATWIGADSGTGDFIQVGVIEDDLPKSNQRNYWAFWSDTLLDLHPHRLAQVDGGDRVIVDMSLEAPGWLLSVTDKTQGWTKTMQSHFGASEYFQNSEWDQEDPVSSLDPSDNVPYPSLSPLVLSGAMVNGAVVHFRLHDGEAMDVLNGPILVAKIDGPGTFRTVVPSGAQLRYLSSVAVSNHHLNILRLDLESPNASTQRLHIDEQRLLKALDTANRELASTKWPSVAVTRDVHAFVKQNERLANDAGQLVSSDLSQASLQSYEFDEVVESQIGAEVRSLLGLPPG